MDIRYNHCFTEVNVHFLSYYVIVCTYLRYLILGEEEFRKENYGLVSSVKHMPEFTKKIIRKVMHLIIDHKIKIPFDEKEAYYSCNQVNYLDVKNIQEIMQIIEVGKSSNSCSLCENSNETVTYRKLIDYYRNNQKFNSNRDIISTVPIEYLESFNKDT
jgi:hypothetical protein